MDLDLLDAIGHSVGGPVEPAVGPPRSGDIRHSQADISVARQTLGYEVIVPFGEGIAKTVAWYRQHQRTEQQSDQSVRE